LQEDVEEIIHDGENRQRKRNENDVKRMTKESVMLSV
jgi:hypothetical protein